MKLLIAGLGSMGKRRIRNLTTLGYTALTGFDLRADRREEVERLFHIPTLDKLPEASSWDALVVSTPPQHHDECLSWGLDQHLPTFVELSVVLRNLRRLQARAKKENALVAPSCTFLYHPAIATIQNLVREGAYGKVTAFNYHSGQYLPDWHPWETVNDFFVRHPETSGCRELLSFELHWLCEVFGFPQALTGQGRRSLGFGLPADDVLALQLLYPQAAGTLLIDTVSRFATRSLTVNLEKAQVRWRWEQPVVQLYNPETRQWIDYPIQMTAAEKGYNENLTETMYIQEMAAFTQAVLRRTAYPYDLERDIRVLELMAAIPDASLEPAR